MFDSSWMWFLNVVLWYYLFIFCFLIVLIVEIIGLIWINGVFEVELCKSLDYDKVILCKWRNDLDDVYFL